jgi:hypothetical protein
VQSVLVPSDKPTFSTEGLSSAFVARAATAFHALGCSAPPIQNLASTLVSTAQLHGIEAAAELGQTFSLVVAACHSIGQLPGPPWPLEREGELAAPTTTEWVLLASRQIALSSLPLHLRKAFNDVIAKVADAANDPVKLGLSSPSPIADYGIGALLAAAGWQTAEAGAPETHAMGKLARLVFEIEALTSTQFDIPCPLALGSIAARVGLGPRFDLALALACKPAPDKLPLVALAGHSAVWTRIAAESASWTDEATNSVDELSKDIVREAMNSMSSALLQRVNGLRLFGFTPAPSMIAELDRAVKLAVAALGSDAELRESWDVQRWGGFFSTTCVAKFFPLGLCALALDAASVDVADRVRALLALGGPDGFRYFEDFTKIPPDTDDLGMALALAARLPRDPALMETLAWPIEVFIRNTGEDGAIPVWLEKHLREPMASDAPTWRGSRCIAAAANVLIGAIEMGAALPAAFLDRSIGWIVRTWQLEGTTAAYFYGASYTRFILARLFEVADARIEDPEVRSALRFVVEEICADAARRRRMDGSLGNILDTACHLAALACSSDASFDPWPSVTYLVTRQDPDGLWPHQPLYLTLGKDNVPAAHGSRAITAALCLYALARWRRRIVPEST